MNNRSYFRNLVLSAGGDAFMILTSVFMVLLVTANFQSPCPQKSFEEEYQQSKEEIKRLKKEVEQAKNRLEQAENRLQEFGMSLTQTATGSQTQMGSGTTRVYYRSEGDIMIETSNRTFSVSKDRLTDRLAELESSKVILLAEPGVTFEETVQLMDDVRSTLPEATTSIGTLKK